MTYKMETYHKIQTLFKRDMDGSITGQKGKMIDGAWTTNELKYLAGNQWEFTEKVDGTNIRIGYYKSYHGYPRVAFGGRTDNAVIPDRLLEHLEETFTPELFEKAGLDECVLYGEGYGPKIQGGGKYRDDHSFVLFDVKIGQWWLTRPNVDDIALKLGIDSVPTIGYGTLHQGINFVKYGTPYLPEEVESIRRASDTNWLEGKFMRSTWGDFEAEGIVARPSVPMFDRKGERIITKIKTVDFR